MLLIYRYFYFLFKKIKDTSDLALSIKNILLLYKFIRFAYIFFMKTAST